MILIDSSIWIGYFRSGENAEMIENLLHLDIVCTNQIILSEIIPNLQHQKKFDLIDSIQYLKCIPYQIFWEGIRALQLENIKNGVNKVGLLDLMIAQNCIDNNLELWTLDKHFKLMSKHLKIKIFEN